MGSRFFQGFTALGRALPLAFEDPKLRRLALAPALLTLIASLAAAVAAFRWGHLLIERYQVGHGALIAVFLWLVLVVGVAAATWLAWLLVGLLATAPFADALAERTEELEGAPPLPRQRILAAAGQSLRGLAQTLLSVTIYVGIAVPLFVAQLVVPVIAPVAAVVGLGLTAQFLAYDLFDPALSRRGRSFAEKWKFLGDHRAEALGLGLAAALASAVPLLGVLVIPVATIAATQLFVKHDKIAPHS